jgi:uncharacterized protein with HEPN domain
MFKRGHFLLLADMLEAVNRILEYTHGIDFDQFTIDSKTKDAVIRNFEILGEAANRIPNDYQIQNPHIPWKQLRGYRNRLIHEYFGVDYHIVWEIIQTNLSELQYQLERALQADQP